MPDVPGDDFFRRVLEGAPGLYVVLAPDDYEILCVTDSFVNTTAATREQLVGLRLFDLIPADTSVPFAGALLAVRESLERVKSTLAPDTMAPYRLPARRPGGGVETRTWRAVNQPVLDADGNLAYLVHAVEDVTDQEAARIELERTQELLQIASQTARIGGWLFRPARDRVEWSDEVCTIHEAPLGTNPTVDEGLNYYAPEWRDTVRQAFWNCFREGISFDLEARIVTTTGRHVWVRTIGNPVRDKQGNVIQVQGAIQDISERKAAEESAERLAERLNTTLESIGDGLYTLDREWRFTYFNRKAEELLRLTPQQLQGRVLWDVLPKPYSQTLQYHFLRAAELQEAAHYETYFAPSNTWFGVSVYPSEDGLSIYFRDITEQHRIRQELEESESRFRAIARATVDVIWDWDRRTDHVWWNDGLQNVFGYPPDEVTPGIEFWRERVHPDDREQVVNHFHEAIARGEQHWQDEYRFLHHDGSYRDVEDRGFLILDNDGEPIRLVGGISDITEHKRLQGTLLRQAALLDEAAEAILVRGPEDDVQYWNRGAERLYGWSAEEALGQPVAGLLYDDPAAFRAATTHVRAHGEWNGQLTQKRRDGTYLIVECHWTLLYDALSEPGSILAINSDITERKGLEEQLRQSQRLEAVGQLTGGVAHDFNNLLTVILGSSELFIEQLGENERLRSLAEMTRAAAHRGAELTQRLLAFARRQALDPAPININRLLSGMDPLLRRTLPANVEIELVQAGGLWSALVDSAQLESAVLNLCLNARDAMQDGGRLTIETANSYLDFDYADRHTEVNAGRYVLVAITDTGAGMPNDVLERAFDPFFTTKPVGRGTGLGLSMVYGFIKQSGGHVKIYSEIGQGTTVKLYLPRALQDDTGSSPSNHEIPEQGGSETILVVEDDDLVRQHVEDQLRSLGYQVIAAANGDAGLAAIRSGAGIDLLFTDVVMPGTLNGRQLADAARALRPDLKVLFTSGYTENAIVHQGRLDPGVHLLSKPYRRAALARKVRQVLNQD